MKNEKAENQKMEDVYNKEYLPSIVRVGRFVLLASTLFFFAPFLYTWIGWGVTPDCVTPLAVRISRKPRLS